MHSASFAGPTCDVTVYWISRLNMYPRVSGFPLCSRVQPGHGPGQNFRAFPRTVYPGEGSMQDFRRNETVHCDSPAQHGCRYRTTRRLTDILTEFLHA